MVVTDDMPCYSVLKLENIETLYDGKSFWVGIVATYDRELSQRGGWWCPGAPVAPEYQQPACRTLCRRWRLSDGFFFYKIRSEIATAFFVLVLFKNIFTHNYLSFLFRLVSKIFLFNWVLFTSLFLSLSWFFLNRRVMTFLYPATHWPLGDLSGIFGKWFSG